MGRAVIGAGLAGLATALEAEEAGARVLLLEREAAPGGNSRISSGLVALSGTASQLAAGVSDDADLLFDDLRRTGGHANDPALVRAFADGQSALARWFDQLGLRCTGLGRDAGQLCPVPTSSMLPMCWVVSPRSRAGRRRRFGWKRG